MQLITTEPISVQDLTKTQDFPHCGALCTFEGLVRNHHKGKSVQKLIYTAYQEMAEKEILRLIDVAKTKWPEIEASVQHRIGTLNIGEVAIAIAVWSPHRKESFLACEFLIDEIKRNVPIWKKEFYQDSSHEWVICSHQRH